LLGDLYKADDYSKCWTIKIIVFININPIIYFIYKIKYVLAMPDNITDLEIIDNSLIERFNVTCLSPAIGTYKHVCSKRIGTNIFELEISGLLSLNNKGEFVSGDCKEQTLIIIDNLIKTIICSASHYNINLTKEEAINHITNTIVLLNKMEDFPLVNEAYKEAGMPFTCRAAFSVKELPLTNKGALIEIRANALIKTY